jgi:hypothetical protein
MTNQRSAKLVLFSNLGGKLLQYLLAIVLIGSSYADTSPELKNIYSSQESASSNMIW